MIPLKYKLKYKFMKTAYKATYNMKCETLTYEVGKTYIFDNEIIPCRQGFHACKNPEHTLLYYPYNKDFKLLEVKVLGEIIEQEDKIVTNRLKVLRVVPEEETLKLLNIKIELEKNNKIICHKKIDGTEYWQEFDENNNLVHFKNSDNFEYWQKFDKNNNLIHFKVNDDYEQWREYDKNNNLIYSINSDDCEGIYDNCYNWYLE